MYGLKKCFTVKHNKLVITIIVVNNTDFFILPEGSTILWMDPPFSCHCGCCCCFGQARLRSFFFQTKKEKIPLFLSKDTFVSLFPAVNSALIQNW